MQEFPKLFENGLSQVAAGVNIAFKPAAKTVEHSAAKRKRKIMAGPAKVAPVASKECDWILSAAHVDALNKGPGTWNKDCSQQYGSFSRDSEFYFAAAGRRKPRSMR
jgi:hypothetical protein